MTEEATATTVEAGSEPGNSTNLFAFWGAIFLLGGITLMLVGFLMDASVAVPTYDSLGVSTPDRVNNIGQLNTKLMLVIAGSGLMISGSVFLARNR